MAGPVLMLHAKPDLTPEITRQTHAWLRDEVARPETFRFESWESTPPNAVTRLWPQWGFQAATEFRRRVEVEEWRPLTLGFAPFGGEIGASYQPFDMLGVEELLGFLPAFNVQIFSMSNQPSDHRVLGQLALEWARRFDALIELDLGVVIPTLLLPDLPGQYRRGEVIFDYETGPEIHHIGAADTKWMSAWLEHPNYFLLK